MMRRREPLIFMLNENGVNFSSIVLIVSFDAVVGIYLVCYVFIRMHSQNIVYIFFSITGFFM